MKEIEREITKWRFRHLSLEGKVVIIKSLLLSKVSHLFMALPDPLQKVINELNKALYTFLWHGKAKESSRSR